MYNVYVALIRWLCPFHTSIDLTDAFGIGYQSVNTLNRLCFSDFVIYFFSAKQFSHNNIFDFSLYSAFIGQTSKRNH